MVSIYEQEAELTPLIVNFATLSPDRANDTMVDVLCYGEYSERQENANFLAKNSPGKCMYIALHLNSGKKMPPYYGLIGHDYRSAQGGAFATLLKNEWVKYVPDTRVIATSASSGEVFIRHMQYTIAGIFHGPDNIAGICSEPLFIDVVTPVLLRNYANCLHRAFNAFCNL